MIKYKKIRTAAAIMAVIVSATSMSGVAFTPVTNVYAAETSVATASIDEILKNQQSDGGWRKNYETTSGDWSHSTIDNNATYTEIRRLAAEYKKSNNTKCKDAAIKGINFLLNFQLSNGGFPQVANASGYHTHITFNDNAMVNVLYLLDDVANKKGDFSFVDDAMASKAKTAVDKGVDCILKCQQKDNGQLTVWGQQHDENTLALAGGRAYELPSLCSSESANIVKFLTTRKATPEINAAIAGAVKWFNDCKLTGIKVEKKDGDVIVTKDSSSKSVYWARFYEEGTNRPIFVGRDGVKKYNLSEIEKERRTGYAWYGSWGSSIVNIKVEGSSSSSSQEATKAPTTEETTKAPTTEETTKAPTVATAASTLKMGDLKAEKLKADKTSNGFTIEATSKKTVKVESTKQTCDGIKFGNVLKLSGKGTSDYRSISFTAEKGSTVTVYASSSLGSSRKVSLCKGGKALQSTALSKDAKKYTFTVSESGNYYVTSLDGAMDIYQISISK